jgi:psiF repeat
MGAVAETEELSWYASRAIFNSVYFPTYQRKENMKIIIAVLGFALLAMPVLAAAEQQEKTKACEAAAAKKGLKGDKRKAYVKDCLLAKAKAKPGAAAKPETKAPRATPAVPAPATTAPAKPSASSAATPATNPPAPGPNSAAEKKRLKCEDFARQSNVSPSSKKTFMDKCMAG